VSDGKVNVEITGNAASLTGAAKQAASALKTVETAASSAGKNTSSSLENVDKAASKLSTSVTKAGSAAKTLESAAASGAKSLTNTASAAGQAESKFGTMAAQSAKAALGLSGFGSGLASMVSPLGLASTAVVGLGVKSVGMAADFETSMAKLQVMTGVTDKSSVSFKQLEDAAISVGEKTKFSGQEAADGMADLAAAGLNVKDTIAAINPVAQAAAINQVGISDAAKVATVSMNAFGLKASEVSKVIDVTTTAANLGVLKFQDFGQAMAAVGSVAKLSNQSLTGVTSALIALTNNGQSAADAGTSIKSALLALTNPTAEGAAAMKELGLNIFDAQGKMRPFAEIVKQIEVGTKGMTDAQKNQLLATIAGSDGIRAFSGALNASVTVQRNGREVTLQGSDALKEFQRQLDNSGGAAQKAADILDKTLNSKLEQTKGKVDELTRKIGTALIPALNQLLDTFNSVLDNGPLKSATDSTTRNLDNISKSLDKAKSSTEGLDKVTQGVVGSFENYTRTLAQSATERSSYIQDNIDTRKALQDNIKAVEAHALAQQQVFAQSEFNRKKMQELNFEIDRQGLSFAKLSAPMQAIADKYDGLTGKISSLEIEMGSLARANDELNSKLGANNQLINTMSIGVDQLALKHQNAKIAFEGTNHSLQEGYDQWVKYTEIQAAGGDGAVEAGKKAGDLAKQLTGVDKSFQPLLDTTFNAITANSKLKDSVVSNTEASAKLQQAIDPLTEAQHRADDAFEEAAIKARTHGGALLITAQGADTAKIAIDGGNKVLGIWNSTPMSTKTTDTSTIAAVRALMEGAVAALRAWNGLKLDNKSATVTTTNIAQNIGIGAAPAPAPVQRPSLGQSAGLSGTLANFDRFGGGGMAGAAALAQATQAAQVVNFSLASLKDNIDAIVKLFKDIDSKALKAAADQAESVSKIASAASGMVDLFAKLKDYSRSSAEELMMQVAKDSAEMTKAIHGWGGPVR
jgi:TP901 family phage tail tape measure protein